MVQALLVLMDSSSQQGWRLGDVCGWQSTHSVGFGVGHSALSLCAPVQEQHLVSCPGCQREALLGASTDINGGLPMQTLAHFLPSLSRILQALQQPPSNQVALGPVFLTYLFLFQV